MDPKKDTRIVSKGEYVRLMGRKVGLSISSMGLSLLAVLFFLSAAGAGWFCLRAFATLFNLSAWTAPGAQTAIPWWSGFEILFLGLFSFALSVLTYIGGRILLRVANNGMATATKDEHVLPFTRANTADLPAPDSLVRASSEPEQAQQAVLLRAATEGMETPPEQLVRASVGGQE